jgi:tRNA(Leu) C34 or U34 (ribose-2'-O)-methylase TrmL
VKTFKRGFFGVGLDNPKFYNNVGAAQRAVSAYAGDFFATTGKRFKRSAAVTDTTKMWRHVPYFQADDLKNIIPYDCVPVAIDIVDDAIPLPEFKHPERAFYIFGAEDATLGDRTISWCAHTVYVPTLVCMNLAACVNVVLYDRLSKTLMRHNKS